MVGRFVYQGDASKCAAYFKDKLGKPLPLLKSEADSLINIMHVEAPLTPECELKIELMMRTYKKEFNTSSDLDILQQLKLQKIDCSNR